MIGKVTPLCLFSVLRLAYAGKCVAIFLQIDATAHEQDKLIAGFFELVITFVPGLVYMISSCVPFLFLGIVNKIPT